jgi:hypothetical protein
MVWDLDSNWWILRVIAVICRSVADLETRVLTLVPPAQTTPADSVPMEAGLADVVTLQRRCQARASAQDAESFFIDTISEYQWARDAAGLAPSYFPTGRRGGVAAGGITVR